MRILKYLFPVWCGIILYSAMSICVGNTGRRPYSELLEEKNRQIQNMEELQNLNNELQGMRDSLKYDSDTISVYARELGFGSEDEKFMRIVGDSNVRRQQIISGDTLRVTEPLAIADSTLRLISVATAIVIFLFLAFTGIFKALYAK
jgi:cell division protein FtsB